MKRATFKTHFTSLCVAENEMIIKIGFSHFMSLQLYTFQRRKTADTTLYVARATDPMNTSIPETAPIRSYMH